jgi:Flp pilus assembly protein TadB
MTALISAGEYLPQRTPLVEELAALKRRVKGGGDEVKELEGFLREWRHHDAELLKRCLILSRTHGSSLGEPLHRITRVVRQRQSFRRKTRAAMAMHRLSAFGIALCAGMIGTFQGVLNRDGLAIAMSHPYGGKFLSAGIGLIVVGVAWMVSMGNQEASR